MNTSICNPITSIKYRDCFLLFCPWYKSFPADVSRTEVNAYPKGNNTQRESQATETLPRGGGFQKRELWALTK